MSWVALMAFSDDYFSGKILHMKNRPDVRISESVLRMNLITLRCIILEKCVQIFIKCL